MVKSILKLAGIGLLSSYLAGCSPSSRETKIETFEGELPSHGTTRLITEDNNHTSPNFVVYIESDSLNNSQYPFQRHSLVDEEGDGSFDYGVYPYRPENTNIVMSRRVFRTDNDPDFFRLEKIVSVALSSKGTDLQKTGSKVLTY